MIAILLIVRDGSTASACIFLGSSYTPSLDSSSLKNGILVHLKCLFLFLNLLAGISALLTSGFFVVSAISIVSYN